MKVGSDLIKRAQMKLFAALDPGDIVGAVKLGSSGESIPETSIAFSEQLFDYCRSNDIEILGISSHPRTDKIQIGCVQAENWPKPSWGISGARYHLALLWY